MERSSIGTGLGCLAILPAAVIGLAGLTDGVGPTGWRGFAELFGWVAVCATACRCTGLLFTPRGRAGAWCYLAGAVVAGLLALTVNWLGLAAPMAAKVAYTSTLQIVGVVTMGGCLLLLIRFVGRT